MTHVDMIRKAFQYRIDRVDFSNFAVDRSLLHRNSGHLRDLPRIPSTRRLIAILKPGIGAVVYLVGMFWDLTFKSPHLAKE